MLVQGEHRADEHVPGRGQHHHERPDPVPLTGARVGPLAQETVVNLGFRAGLDLIPQDGDLRSLGLSGQRRLDPAVQRGAGCMDPAFVAEPLVNGSDRDRPEQAADVVAVFVELAPGDLAQSPVGEFREPALDQFGPVLLAHGRPARGDPGQFRRSQVLPDRLAVHPQRRGQLALGAACVPVDVDLDDVDHGERSP